MPKPCPACGGSGEYGFDRSSSHATGEYVAEVCPACHGTGVAPDPCHSKGTEAEDVDTSAPVPTSGDAPTISEVSTGDGLILTPEQRAEYVATVREATAFAAQYRPQAQDALDALIDDAALTREALDVAVTMHDTFPPSPTSDCPGRCEPCRIDYATTEAARRRNTDV